MPADKQQLQAIFKNIYDTNAWTSKETRSGPGSELVATENIRAVLPELIKELGIKSVLDAGCGDLNWWPTIKGISYLGIDIVPELIEENRKKIEQLGLSPKKYRVEVMDVVNDDLPKVDLIVCRQVLFHLSHENSLRVLTNFCKSGSKWLLMTNHPHVWNNEPIIDGHWKLTNFQVEPFNLCPPERIFEDGLYKDMDMALWKLKETLAEMQNPL